MSIEAPRRASSDSYIHSEVEKTDVPSGSIDGFFYTEKAGLTIIDYVQFVGAIKDRIANETTRRFRRRQIEQEGITPEKAEALRPDKAEVENAINEGFDRMALHSLQSLYGTLKQHDLPQHLVFTAHERPATPWEGPVQEWLRTYRQPYEVTGGLYGMYEPDEYPQLHFQRPDGSGF